MAGLAVGTLLVAVGFAATSDPLARPGALMTLVGAVSLAVYAAQTWRTRARWTGDAGWHRFAMGGLVGAMSTAPSLPVRTSGSNTYNFNFNGANVDVTDPSSVRRAFLPVLREIERRTGKA